MELIERYLYQVGRYLPRKKREDILTELRSNLLDALKVPEGGEADEQQVVALLEEMGPPEKIAASYHTGMSYLIGPELFPLFRLVTSIALVAVFGSLILAMAVGAVFDPGSLQPGGAGEIFETIAGLWNALISTLGTIVIVFAILQYFGFRPTQEEKWDARSLPPVTPKAREVNRWELAFELGVDLVLIALLNIFVSKNGVLVRFEDLTVSNPVIQAYVPQISIALVISIAFSAFMLQYGRWTFATRLAKVAANLVSIAVLALLINGHIEWLNAHGGSSFLTTLESLNLLPQMEETIVQGLTIQAFRLGFTIALVVESIETVVEVIRLGVQTVINSGGSPVPGLER